MILSGGSNVGYTICSQPQLAKYVSTARVNVVVVLLAAPPAAI